ncbi:MAG: hypothetical protein ACFFAO_14270 [Candidatus Hermodarchaeota archaeon]
MNLKMSVIQDFWIISKSGFVLFNRVFDPNMKTQLFGALMSALNSFAEHVVEGEGLSKFELHNKKYFIKKTVNYIFIASSFKNIKEKKIKVELEEIINKFLEEYPDEWFENWNFDLNVFKSFDITLDGKLDNTVKYFWSGF